MSGVLKDSVVFTLDGHKSIQELKVGDKLLTHNNHYRDVKEIHQVDADKGDLLLIKAWCCRPLVVTKETKLLVYEIGYKEVEWVAAKDLHHYHMLATTKRIDDEHLVYSSTSYARDKLDLLFSIFKKYADHCGSYDPELDVTDKPEYEEYLEQLTDEEKNLLDGFQEWSAQNIMQVIAPFIEEGCCLLPQPFTDELYHLTRHIGFTMFNHTGLINRSSQEDVMHNRHIDEKTGVDYFRFTVEPYDDEITACYNVIMDEDHSFAVEAFVIHS